MSIDATGKFAFVANYVGGSIDGVHRNVVLAGLEHNALTEGLAGHVGSDNHTSII